MPKLINTFTIYKKELINKLLRYNMSAVTREEFDKLKEDVEEIQKTILNYFKNKNTKVRTKESIKGNAKSTVTVNANKTTATKSSAAASSTASSTTSPKVPNIRTWTINTVEKLKKDVLAVIKIDQKTLDVKFKDNYEDPKYKAKNEKAQLRAEGAWIYKEYIQNNPENKTAITNFRKKVDSGEYSDNKVEENSTEE